MKKYGILLAITYLFTTALWAQLPWSQRIANSVMLQSPSTYGAALGWNYVNGTTLSGFQALYQSTKNSNYLTYIESTVKAQMSGFYTASKTLDNVKEGTAILFMYENTSNPADKSSYQTKAASIRTLLGKTTAGISRTSEGGLWHKDPDYAWQMWGDGLYMAQPFYAQYAVLFNNADSTDFEDIANQFILFESHARDANTGLLYHGWSEEPLNAKSLAWANATTGLSQSFWGRAMGWYIMGLVDALDYFPKTHPKYPVLVAILQRLVPALVAVQDSTSGCWYDVLDQGTRCSSISPYTCNYLESSATCMITYSILKSVRLGYVSNTYLASGTKAYEGILANFISITNIPGGEKVLITKDCQVSGLGGNKNRAGTFDYYMSEPIVSSDLDGKPIGPFILSSLEYEALQTTGLKKVGIGTSDFRITALADKELLVHLALNEKATVSLTIMDINGKMQSNLLNEELAAGIYTKKLSVQKMPRGIYIVQLMTNSEILSQKLYIP